jgi:hypothetical protein
MCAVLLAVGCICPSTPAARSATIPGLHGFWEHDRCQVQERDGRRTSSRSLFAIFDREWGIAFTQYVDAACQTPAMTAVLRGPYEPTGASRDVPGAFDVTFRFARKALVAHDAALVDRLNAACGGRRWRIGVEQDVTSTGCLGIASIGACPHEYDLVRIANHELFLGERPRPGEDICAEHRRPQRLRAEALRRR